MAKKRVRKRATRKPKKPLPQFSFLCPGCESWVDVMYLNKPNYNGMTGRTGPRRMVLACEGCGCVIAERTSAAERARRGLPALLSRSRPAARRAPAFKSAAEQGAELRRRFPAVGFLPMPPSADSGG